MINVQDAASKQENRFDFSETTYRILIGDDNIMRVTIFGKWTREVAEEAVARTRLCLDELERRGLPRLALYDIRDIKLTQIADGPTMRMLLEAFSALKFDAIAAFGGAALAIASYKLLTNVFPGVSKARMFSNGDKALAYLQDWRTK